MSGNNQTQKELQFHIVEVSLLLGRSIFWIKSKETEKRLRLLVFFDEKRQWVFLKKLHRNHLLSVSFSIITKIGFKTMFNIYPNIKQMAGEAFFVSEIVI